MTAYAKQDWAVIRKSQIDKKDYIRIRGQYLKVKGVGIDFNSDARNIVRSKTDFKINVNNQKFFIGKEPVIQGRILKIEHDKIAFEKLVSMSLKKIDEDNIGVLTIAFRNACFNNLGFLTHDTAIQI